MRVTCRRLLHVEAVVTMSLVPAPPLSRTAPGFAEASSNAAAASELRQRLQKRQRAASEVGALPENGDAAATTDGPATDAVDADDAPEKAEEVKAEVCYPRRADLGRPHQRCQTVRPRWRHPTRGCRAGRGG